jgi:hypothetical protein
MTLIMDVKQEVDECVRIIHPAQVEYNDTVEAAETEGLDLHDSRDEHCECRNQDRSRLFLNRFELFRSDFLVHECPERRNEAEKVLNVNSDSDANARDIRVSRYRTGHDAREQDGYNVKCAQNGACATVADRDLKL